jgi:hypothetical protein
VAGDDPLDDRETGAEALVLLGPVQPLEDAEELVRVLGIEARFRCASVPG